MDILIQIRSLTLRRMVLMELALTTRVRITRSGLVLLRANCREVVITWLRISPLILLYQMFTQIIILESTKCMSLDQFLSQATLRVKIRTNRLLSQATLRAEIRINRLQPQAMLRAEIRTNRLLSKPWKLTAKVQLLREDSRTLLTTQ